MNKLFSNLAGGAKKGAAATVKNAEAFVKNPRICMMAMMLFMVSITTFAQDVDAGLAAIETSTESLKRYVPVVTNLCYAIAGIVAMIGAISVYVKMNNEEQDVKKSIMMIVGACIFLIAAAQCLPLFFGLQYGQERPGTI